MSWKEKSDGDGLSSEEWNNHVEDQQSRAKTTVQRREPEIGPEGDVWAKTTSELEDSWFKNEGEGDLNDVSTNNGVAYQATDEDNVIATDDVSKLWIHNLHDGAVNSIDSSSNAVYSGGRRGKVIKVDSEDGSSIWVNNTNDDLNRIRDVFHSNNTVYATLENSVLALDDDDGSELWTHELHTSTVSSVHESNGIICSASWDDTVVAADVEDGSELWTHELHNTSVVSVYVSNSVVYSEDSNGKIIAADVEDGSELWSYTTPDDDWYSDHIVVYDNIVYTIVDGEIFGLSVDDGSIEIKENTGYNPHAHAVNDGLFVYASSDSQVVRTYSVNDLVNLYISDGDNWIPVGR